MSQQPLWMSGVDLPAYPKLDSDLTVDVAVIGGGITGVTTAYLLKKAGIKVALFERDRCGRVDTGHTTAHLTCVTDARLSDLARRFGPEHAQAAWDAGNAAIGQIDDIVHRHEIDCEWRAVPGYLHASLEESRDEAAQLQEEAQLAASLGFDAVYLDSVPLVQRPGIRFANQAKFHPLKYLAGLLRRTAGRGCRVFEDSHVEEVTDNPTTVRVNGHTVHCRHVVICTHVPLMGKTGLVGATLFQTKLASYSTYAIASSLPEGVSLHEASWWDTSNPYYYLRIDRSGGQTTAVFGGADHKTGQEENTDDRLSKLESILHQFLPGAQTTHQWTGQVVETPDGLPYIGEITDGQFVATGFAGNGMTFGTLAAMMACDAVQHQKNPWAELFDVHRKVLRSPLDYVRENLDYPYYMVKDRLVVRSSSTLRHLRRGKGKVVSRNGQRIAAYRGADGKLSQRSAVCPHMGCIVHWNESDSTWDCPCHGSRFKAEGELLAGPAESPLPPLESK